MDSTKNESPTKSQEQHKPQPKPQPVSVRVHVPISVTLFVPVDIEGFEIDDDAPHASLASTPVVDCTEMSNGPDLLAAAVRDSKDSPACIAAQVILRAAVDMHRLEYPTHKATMTLYQGVMEETEI